MKKRLLFILIVFIAWLPVFVIQKPVFMFYQHALSEACTFTDFLQVMLHGLKLDCTIAGYLTAIPLLLTLVSVWLPGAWLKKVLKGYFLIMGILVSAIFSVDVALYSFWGFRLDATLFFYLQSPADAMASVPLGMFFIQLLVFVAYTLSIYAWFTFILRFAPALPYRRWRWRPRRRPRAGRCGHRRPSSSSTDRRPARRSRPPAGQNGPGRMPEWCSRA